MENKKDDKLLASIALQLTYMSTQDLCMVGIMVAEELKTRNPSDIPEEDTEDSSGN